MKDYVHIQELLEWTWHTNFKNLLTIGKDGQFMESPGSLAMKTQIQLEKQTEYCIFIYLSHVISACL